MTTDHAPLLALVANLLGGGDQDKAAGIRLAFDAMDVADATIREYHAAHPYGWQPTDSDLWHACGPHHSKVGRELLDHGHYAAHVRELCERHASLVAQGLGPQVLPQGRRAWRQAMRRGTAAEVCWAMAEATQHARLQWRAEAAYRYLFMGMFPDHEVAADSRIWWAALPLHQQGEVLATVDELRDTVGTDRLDG